MPIARYFSSFIKAIVLLFSISYSDAVKRSVEKDKFGVKFA